MKFYVNLLLLLMLASCARTVSDTELKVGEGTDVDIVIEAELGKGGSNPYINYNATDDRWEVCNEGASCVSIGSGNGTSGVLSTGVVVSNPSATTASISDGNGVIWDYSDPENPVPTVVSWTGLTGFAVAGIGSTTFTSVGVNAAGAVVQKSGEVWDSLERRDVIVIGAVSHSDTANINGVATIPQPAYGGSHHAFDLSLAIGPINASGNIYGPNGANLNIDKSAGQTMRIGHNYLNDVADPNFKDDLATVAANFVPVYRDGGGGFTFGAPAAALDVGQYDDGDGTLGTVNGNNWSIFRVLWSPGTAATFIHYGQAEYSNFANAADGILTEVFELAPGLEAISLRGYIIARGGGTDLSDSADAVFVEAGKFGAGIVGGTGAPSIDMQRSYEGSSQPQIVVDSGRGGVQVLDASTPIAAPLIEILSNDTLTNYFTVAVSGNISTDLDVQGSLTATSTTEFSRPCPIMTEAQRDLIVAANGDCVNNTDSGSMEFFDGTAWILSGGSVSTVTKNSSGPLALTGENNIICDTSGGGVVLQLPTVSSNSGLTYSISKSSDSNICTLDPSGLELIGGVASYVMDFKSDSAIITTEGTEWHFLSKDAAAIEAESIEVSSTTVASTPAPPMTTVQKDALTPTAGQQVYDSTLGELQYWNGLTWVSTSFQTLNSMTNWDNYTPIVTGLGTGSSTNVGEWRQVGDSIQIQVGITKDGSAGTGATPISISIPPGLNIDTSKLTGIAGGVGTFGFGNLTFGAGFKALGVIYGSSNTISLIRTDGNATFNGADFPATQVVNAIFTLPIVGWTSGLDAVVENRPLLHIEASRSTAQAFTNVLNTDVIYNVVNEDNSGGAYNSSTGVFTATRDIRLNVCATVMFQSALWNATSVGQMMINYSGKSAVLSRPFVGTTNQTLNMPPGNCAVITMSDTDTAVINIFQNSGITQNLVADASFNRLTITEIPDNYKLVGTFKKCQTKFLTSDVVSDTNDIADLRFSNLSIGNTYSVQMLLMATYVNQDNIGLTAETNSVVICKASGAGNSSAFSGAASPVCPFIADATTLVIDAVSIAGGNTVNGDGTVFETLVTLCEENYTTTTQW